MIWAVTFVFLLAVLGILLVAKLRRNRKSAESFKSWLRDPQSFYDQGGRVLADLEAHPEPDVSDRQIRSWVRELLKDSKSGRAGRLLSRVGERAVPPLLEALRDPNYRKSVSKEPRAFSTSPLGRVIDVLGWIGSPAAIPALTLLASDEDEQIRLGAILALGAIAQPACAEPISSVFATGSENLCSYALIGISRAIEHKRAASEFLENVFDALNPLLTMEKSASVPASAARTLLATDRERAIIAIVSDEVLTTRNPGLSSVLKTLSEENVPVPANRLWRLEKELALLPMEYPHDTSYGYVLLMLASIESEGVEERISAALNLSSTRVQQMAAAALASFRGAKDPIRLLFELEKEGGWSAMTTAQQRVYAVYWLECEVNNGGFSQYFFNTAGDNWPEALAGLEAMEAFVTAGLLRKATGLFGTDGPSRDRIERQKQLAMLIDEQESEFDALDSAFYEGEDRLGVRMMKYVAENAEKFQT